MFAYGARFTEVAMITESTASSVIATSDNKPPRRSAPLACSSGGIKHFPQLLSPDLAADSFMDHHLLDIDMEAIEDEESYEGPDGYVDEDDAEDYGLEVEDAAEEQSIEGAATIGQLLDALASRHMSQEGQGEVPTNAASNREGGRASNTRLHTITLDDLHRILGLGRSTLIPEAGEDEDEEDEEDEDYSYSMEPNWDRSRDWYPKVMEPKKEGLSLLMNGEFGRLQHQIKSRTKDNNIAKLLLNRGTRPRPTPKEDLASDVLPNTSGTSVASYQANAYVGQYSSDSAFYYTCVRDFRLHVYDTAAPLVPYSPIRSRVRDEMDYGHETTMKVIKTIHAHPGRWTITDSHLSPDNQRMIYASISNTVYMTTTLDSSPVQTPIRFADPLRGRRGATNVWDYEDEHFGIWSCKFSADGNEVIAGGSGMIFVYDLLADQRTVKIQAHNDDVNSCCWADTASGNVLVSASDDTFIKVWDRRSLGASPKPSGVLVGHTEGITYVSAKGDGRYIISNGKDQVLRLWDLRKMRSNSEIEPVEKKHFGIPHFDYRGGTYPRPRFKAHPLDCSVMQYTGHEVLRTLIRCHFSPAETTGQQYIYSGGSDGRIHIWSLDGKVAQVLDRSETLPMSFDPSGPEPQGLHGGRRTRICVRDVSWHSEQPVLMSAGWLGGRWSSREGSVIARHEWKGLSKRASCAVEDWAEKQKLERAERAQRRAQRLEMPGAFSMVSDEED